MARSSELFGEPSRKGPRKGPRKAPIGGAEGFTERQIAEHIGERHDIAIGKALRRRVALALRRGLDFGILARRKNRFRFDPDGDTSSPKTAERRVRRGGRSARKGRRSRRGGGRRREKAEEKRPRMPRMPKPASWTPKRRNLNEEPIRKAIKRGRRRASGGRCE